MNRANPLNAPLLALFILLVFALIASAYVFKKGLDKGDRTTHELLLKCVIIVTSVVPRHLPMQVRRTRRVLAFVYVSRGPSA